MRLHGPRLVNISRPTAPDTRVSVVCSSSPSNPPASILFKIYSNDDRSHHPSLVVRPADTLSEKAEALVAYSDAWSEYKDEERGHVINARMSLRANAIEGGRMRIVCEAERDSGYDGKKATDEMHIVVECTENYYIITCDCSGSMNLVV